MYWAPCLRIDLSADASATDTFELTTAAEPLLEALAESVVGRLSVAVSGAAIEAFEAYGLTAFFDRLARLADAGRLELLATAAHDALLPLLPVDEVERQLSLNDHANKRVFGDLYNPTTLWCPALAVSPKVLHAAARRGLTGLIVDEAAMRVWPGRLTGERIDGVRGLPGLFLYPASRTLSDAFESGVLPRHLDWEALHLDRSLWHPRYAVTTLELRPTRRPRALVRPSAFVGSLRLDELLAHFPHDEEVSPLPSSRRSTADELGHGHPFASWYVPDNPLHGLQWKLAGRMSELVDESERLGFKAHPLHARLRRVVDLGWRSSWWLAARRTPPDAARILAGIRARDDVLAAFEDARLLPEFTRELRVTCRLLQDVLGREDQQEAGVSQ